METEHSYAPPLDRLLSYGDCRDFKEWPNYLESGFTDKHIPELIRMVQDEDMTGADERLIKEYIANLREEIRIESGYYE